MTRSVAAIVVLFALASCSGASTESGSPRPSRDLITREEIAAIPVSTAFEAVERLRPQFLRPSRGGGTPAVYINGSRSGGLDILRSVRADNVQSIRYYDSVDANLRYGLGNEFGVLNVELISAR